MSAKTKHIFHRLTCILLFSLINSGISFADSILRSPLGDEITIEEANGNQLFEDIPDFQKATFNIYDKNKIVVEVYTTNETEKPRTIIFSNHVMDAINILVESKILQENNNSYHPIYLCNLTTKEMSVDGKMVRWTGSGLEIEVEFGNFVVPLDKIKSIECKKSSEVDSRFGVADDPNTTRLFFGPTGRSLKAGEGYFSVYEVVFPDINYAVLDNVSIGGGISPFSNSEFQMYWFTPKVGLYQGEKVAFSSGLLHFQIHDNFEEDEPLPGDEEMEVEEESDPVESFGIIYSVGTYGNNDYSVTFGVGFPYGKEITERPVFMLGGEYRLGQKTKLISENWVLPFNNRPLFLLGVRWFGRKMAVDFALGRMSGMEVFAIPWVDFVINF